MPTHAAAARGALRDRAVVITGASSGLGRAAAVEFARQGARLVLAARRGDALRETARLCGDADGTRALCVEPTPPGGVVHGMCDYWTAKSALRHVVGRRPIPKLDIA